MRLFVGIPVPKELATTLYEIAGKLPPTYRLTAPELMHVTLSFLGEAPAESLPCVVTKLEQVVSRAFTITLLGLGTFPGVVFAQLCDEPQLTALAADVAHRLEHCGFPAEQRPYRPHVTLARSRDRRVKLKTAAFPALQFVASEFVLYRSFLGPQGSRYERLRHFGLAAPA